jgi:hypothetical protein
VDNTAVSFISTSLANTLYGKQRYWLYYATPFSGCLPILFHSALRKLQWRHMFPRRSYLFLPFLLLAACSDAPTESAKKKEPPKPPEPVTGRYAFHQMFAAARLWAPDIQALTLVSIPLQEVKAGEGKYPAWQCVFVSPSKRRAKTYS